MRQFSIRAMLCFVLLLFSVQISQAAPLGSPVSNFHTNFNRNAQKIGLKTRIFLSKCETGKVKVCTFSLNEALSILVAAIEKSEETNFVSLIFGGKTADPDDLMSVLFTLFNIYAPNSSSSERVGAFNLMLEKLKMNSKTDVYLHNVKFSPSLVEGVGIIIGVSKD